MKKEFNTDDQLERPFCGYITIWLLCQEDEDYAETFTRAEPSYDSMAGRVLAKERERAGTGGLISNFTPICNPSISNMTVLNYICMHHYIYDTPTLIAV